MTLKNGSMTPLFRVMTPFFKGHADSRQLFANTPRFGQGCLLPFFHGTRPSWSVRGSQDNRWSCRILSGQHPSAEFGVGPTGCIS